MENRRTIRTVVIALCMAAASRAPAAAQGVGAIGGTVADASGGVLPGVTVTLSSAEGTVGSNRETTTDERGAYQFLRLVPGTYSVTAELQGFRRASQDKIVVDADVTARADLRLEVGATEESVTVSGQSPLLDTTSALNQTVLTRAQLDALPNRVNVWSIARVIPSVTLDKVDVGGSESFLNSTATVHGTSSENKYMIDGMDVSSTDGNGTIAAFYLDPYTYHEANYQIGAGNAETQNGGLTFSMITRTGTNQFHGGGMFSGANHAMGFANYSDELKAQLLAAVPPKALAANPNIVPGADIQDIWDTGFWMTGPILRDRLWFSFSAHDQALDQYVLGSYNADGTQVLDDNRMWTLGTKVAWQMTKNGQLSYFNNLQYKLIGHRAGGGTFADSAARNYNYKYPDVHQVKFTSPVTNRFLVDFSASRFRADDWFGQEPEVAADAISHFDSVTSTYTVALPTYRDNEMYRDVFNASFSYFLSAHNLKFGYQYMKAGEQNSNWSTSGMRAVFRSGVPDSVNTYNTPAGFEEWDRDQSLYVQDRWTPVSRLTLNVGLRFDTNYGWQPVTCQQTTPFLQGQCWPANDGVPDFHAFAPRVSVVYDLSGDGRTALKFNASRFNQPIGMSLAVRVNPNGASFGAAGATSDTRAWTACRAGQTSGCDLNGDLLPQMNELGPSSGFNFGNVNHYSPDLEWPVANEYRVEFQRQLPGSVVASLGYTRRETRRNIGSRNLAVPMDSYIPLQVTEANSHAQVTVYNQNPALKGKFDVLWANDPAEDTAYNGADVTLNKRMSNGWALMGGFTVNHTVGDTQAATVASTGQPAGDLNNPNLTFRDGVVGNDSTYSWRLSGVYQFPYQLFVSGTWQYYTGFPEFTTVSVGNNTVSLTQGTTTVTVAPRGDTRLPSVRSLDVTVRRTFAFGSKTIAPRLDLYNLTNAATILARTTQLGPTYGQASSIQRGLLIKAGFDVNF
jgi:hypothetical protein